LILTFVGEDVLTAHEIMTAIDTQRLKSQVLELRETFPDLAVFTGTLHNILAFHHNYALRQSPFITPRTLLKNYRVPPQVIRQIEMGILPQIGAQPDQAVQLAHHLWQDEYINVRELACFILGSLPLTYNELVRDQIHEWVQPGLDSAALEAVLTKATLRLRDETPHMWEAMVLDWLSHPNIKFQSIGLQAIADVIRDTRFPHVPSLFKLLRPFFLDHTDAFQPNLDQVVKALANRTPIEALYFLKEVLAQVSGTEIEAHMRRYANFFPQEQQISLLEAVKSHTRTRTRTIPL